LSSSKHSQPQPDDTSKEKEAKAYFSPPNEVSQPDDIERNPNRKKEAYDGAIEKLKSLIKEKQSQAEINLPGGRTGKIVSVTYTTSTN